MASILNPYINFKDGAREAMEFYKTVFGGELTFSTYAEGGMEVDEANKDRIMHGMLKAENNMVLMGSDNPPGIDHQAGSSISISLSGDNEEELRGYYDKLLVGGTAPMPIAKAPWGDTFGMVTDKFGIAWMVNIAGKKE